MLRPERVPAAEWVLADACELASLEEADLAGCDVVVAATGDDKVNLVVSLLAKTEFAVPRVVARVNRAENEWLFTEQWGVDVAVSKPRLMAALVEEAVTVGDLVRLMTFRQGEANLVEITLPPTAPYVGQPVRDGAAAARLGAGRHRARQAGAGADPGRPAGGRRRADLRLHGRGRGRRTRGRARPEQRRARDSRRPQPTPQPSVTRAASRLELSLRGRPAGGFWSPGGRPRR